MGLRRIKVRTCSIAGGNAVDNFRAVDTANTNTFVLRLVIKNTGRYYGRRTMHQGEKCQPIAVSV